MRLNSRVIGRKWLNFSPDKFHLLKKKKKKVMLCVVEQWEFVQVINLEPGPKDGDAWYRMLAMPRVSQRTEH